VAELIQAAELAEDGEADTAESDVVADWDLVDASRDAWLVEIEAGQLAGYGFVRRHRPGRLGADSYVHPQFTGRGVGRTLVRLTEQRAHELARDDPEGVQVLLYNGVLEHNAAAVALLESEGYRSARRFRKMTAELREPPTEPPSPAGVTIRPVELDRDERAFYEAAQESHRDHWDAVSEDFESWRRKHVEPADADPSLWFVADAGGELAGVVDCAWKTMGKGYVRWLGVRSPWRGRGIGLALLLRAFREFHARGEHTVFLHVDTESPTGATRLYERAGMQKGWTAVIFEKELRAGPAVIEVTG
jgi:ribosomal protein S18 acetylase RimI-like enzyme